MVASRAMTEPANKVVDSNFVENVRALRIATSDRNKAKDATHLVRESKQPGPSPIYPDGIATRHTEAPKQHNAKTILSGFIEAHPSEKEKFH